MNKYKYIILIIFKIIVAQDIIGPLFNSEELINFLNANYKTNTVLGYSNARDTLYSIIDNNNGQVSGIYTNYSIELNNNVDPSTYLYDNGMNCEHLWPQSMGADNEPMKSDMHHLRPSKENVNSSRGNKPFDDIYDFITNTWFWLNYQTNNIPQSNINEYSESGTNNFEPREDVKGDIARSIFYFYTMYKNNANDNFFEIQKNILKDWHYQDPANNQEINRTWSIASYQDNIPNPFIVDSTLIRRCYFYSDIILGDVNSDGTLNIIDVVILVDFILGYQTLNELETIQADINNDGIVNIIDIILLVETILA